VISLISACIITDRPMLKTLETVAGWADEIVVVCSNREVFDDLCSYAESRSQIISMPGGVDADLCVYVEWETKLRWILRYREWDNDFSAARNLSLLISHGEWILYIDSDEWLKFAEGCGPDQLRQVLKTTKADAFWVPFVNWMNEEKTSHTIGRMIRIFRKDKARFEQPVQNALCGFTSADELAGLRIEHDGYDSREKMRKKAEERMPIYEAEIAKEDSDDNWHIWYYYAKNCFFLGDIPKCLEACEKAIDLLQRGGLLNESTPYVDIFRIQATCRLSMGNFYGADAALVDGALCHCPRYSDAYYELYLTHGLLADHYQKCWKAELDLRKQTGEVPPYDLRHWEEENDANPSD